MYTYPEKKLRRAAFDVAAMRDIFLNRLFHGNISGRMRGGSPAVFKAQIARHVLFMSLPLCLILYFFDSFKIHLSNCRYDCLRQAEPPVTAANEKGRRMCDSHTMPFTRRLE